jgi:hypothetical protein
MTQTIDPITVEVLGNAFASLVEEMGIALIKASYSTNIKERRDCSTALFDAQGKTLAQAEHIPIHLGSLLGIVEAVRERYGSDGLRPGDMFIGNDAYTGGGTHLPDIVVVAPVFFDDHLIGFVANLAHHADFLDRGHAHIFQEGLRIPPVKVIEGGALRQEVMDLVLLNCQVPHERLGDFRAQFAANRLGVPLWRIARKRVSGSSIWCTEPWHKPCPSGSPRHITVPIPLSTSLASIPRPTSTTPTWKLSAADLAPAPRKTVSMVCRCISQIRRISPSKPWNRGIR